MIGKPVAFCITRGMDEDDHIELFTFGKERIEAGLGQFLPGDISIDLDTLHAEFLHTALQFGNRHLRVLQRHGTQRNETVGMFGNGLGKPVVYGLRHIATQIRLGPVAIMVGSG